MKEIYLILGLNLAAIFPCMSEPKTLEVGEADASVVLLDRAVGGGQRNPIALPASKRPGQVIVQYRDDPSNDWTEVRWIFRFPLKEVTGPVKHAQLVLWAMSKDKTEVVPRLELIDGAQGEKILPQDRIAKALGSPIDILFPDMPQQIEINVTDLVNLALSHGLAYAAFRIRAETDDPRPKEMEKARFNFGGPINVWNWPQSEPPRLQVEP